MDDIYVSGRPSRKYAKGDYVQSVGNIESTGEYTFRSSIIPKFTTCDKFIDAKIKMLTEDFCINLTYEDIAFLRSFKTEGTVNNAVKAIINKHWG